MENEISDTEVKETSQEVSGGDYDAWDDDSDAVDLGEDGEDDWETETPTKKNKKPQKPTDELDDDETADKKDVAKSIAQKKDVKKEVIAKKSEKDDEQEEELEPKKDEKKPEENEKLPPVKGKKQYLKIGNETFAVDPSAELTATVNGEKVPVTIQELLNEFSGKKYGEKKVNEANNVYQRAQKELAQATQHVEFFKDIVKNVKSVLEDESRDPLEAFEYFIDATGGDAYSLIERMKLHNLKEVEELIGKSDVERKAYFLDKHNKHLLKQTEKRRAAESKSAELNTYTQEVDKKRQALGVSKQQYVDALEELTSDGQSNPSDDEVISWAATRESRASVQQILAPYEDQFSDDVYGELVWTLASKMLSGTSLESIKKVVEAEFGHESKVKELRDRFAPQGRKPKTETVVKARKGYESFDDFNEDDDEDF